MTTPLDVRFKTSGIPVPKGSMSGFAVDRGECSECKPNRPCRGRSCFGGRIVGVSVTDQGDKALKAWQDMIWAAALSARNSAGARPIAKPNACEVSMVFVMPRPDSHWTATGSLTTAGQERRLPTVKPDIDKLARTALDAITQCLVEDDAQVCVAPIAEHYAGWKGWTGVVVHARQVSQLPDWARAELTLAGVWAPPNQKDLL